MKTQPEGLCMGCMEPCSDAVCPRCGWSEVSYSPPPLYLRPRTILDGRYLLGKVLGAGGFGITYLGWDLDLGMKLAIKEYFPSTYGARDLNHSTVIPSTAQGRKLFDQGLSRFLEEGQALAKFQGHPGITSVLTFFRQNGTSYLVMRYEEGITLQEYLRKRGGRIDYEQAMKLAMPVMDSLRAVHEAGILHRDISPDNIFINRSGQIKILDFGSAKHDLANQNQSTVITLKRGYSPEEQYRSNGKVGPWTDIYAMGATIYQAVTGQVPPESLDRLHDDQLQLPIKLGIHLPRPAEAAIMRALAVRAANRFQNMKEFQEALVAREVLDEQLTEVMPRKDLPGKTETRWRMWAALIAALCLIALAALAMTPPRVIRFEAVPAAITVGQTTALHWSVDRGSVSIVPEVGPLSEASGERVLSPATTTTYTLTARHFLRSVTRSLVVIVSPVAMRLADAGPVVRRAPTPDGPDVVVTSFTAPTSGAIGAWFPVSARMQNRGAADAGRVHLGVYFSSTPTVSSSSVLSTLSCTVAGLAAGSTGTCLGNVSVPSTLAPGTYYLTAAVEGPGQANRMRLVDSGPVVLRAPTPNRPDVVLTSFTAPTSGVIGAPLSGTASVQNRGTADAGPVRVGFYLSSTPTVSTSSVLSTLSCTVAGLAAGSTGTCSGNVSVPSTLAPGAYYLTAMVEGPGQVNRMRLADSGPVVLRVSTPNRPDVVVTSFTAPTSGVIGAPLSGTAGLRNQGTGDAGPVRVGFYISSTPTVSTSSVLSTLSCTVVGLAAGGTGTCSGNISVPSSLAPGTYYLTAMVEGPGQANHMRLADSGPVHVSRPTPASGSLIWRGHLDKNTPVEISSSTGTLQGESLPGVPIFVVLEPSDIEIVEPPRPSNGSRRLVVRSHKGNINEVRISWHKVSP